MTRKKKESRGKQQKGFSSKRSSRTESIDDPAGSSVISLDDDSPSGEPAPVLSRSSSGGDLRLGDSSVPSQRSQSPSSGDTGHRSHRSPGTGNTSHRSHRSPGTGNTGHRSITPGAPVKPVKPAGFPRYRENGKKPGFLKYRLPVGRVPGNSVKMSWTRKNPGEMFWFYQGTFGLSKSSPISVLFRRIPLISSCERCPRLLFYSLRQLM